MMRTLHFPNDRSLGTLIVRTISRAGWLGWAIRGKRYGEARGQIKVANDKDVALIVSSEAMGDLSPLLALNTNDLQALVLPLFSINEDVTFYIQKLQGLKLLRMDLAKVSTAEINFLRELGNLEWMYLFCESPDPRMLLELKRALPNCRVSLASEQDKLPHEDLVRSDAKYSAQEMMELANQEGFRDQNGLEFTGVEDYLLAVELDATKEVNSS